MAQTGTYAGDVDVDEAYRLLESDRAAVLIDVRSRAEWTFVGAPDLSGLGKEPVFIEWQAYPSMAVDGRFAATLHETLARKGVPEDAPILFLCRSGARSQSAAVALAGLGFTRCLNVAGGFEGPPDASRHRGRTEGWKARGLPWAQP